MTTCGNLFHLFRLKKERERNRRESEMFCSPQTNHKAIHTEHCILYHWGNYCNTPPPHAYTHSSSFVWAHGCKQTFLHRFRISVTRSLLINTKAQSTEKCFEISTCGIRPSPEAWVILLPSLWCLTWVFFVITMFVRLVESKWQPGYKWAAVIRDSECQLSNNTET